MQDNSSAFYKRVGALGAATALAVSGAFIAAPAVASPAAESDATSTDALLAPTAETPASEPAVDATVADETAEGAGTVAPGLAEALLRDLGMTVEEFEAAGELGKKAAEALPELQATEGFVGITVEDDKIVITGSGEALAALALELDATLVAPAEVTEAPAEEASDAPSAEETEEAAEEAAEEAPAPDKITLPGNYRAAIAEIRADYIANVGVQGLQSIMWNGQGYVISVDKSANVGDSVLARGMAEVADSPAEAIAEKFNNVTVAEKKPIIALEDVVGGQGYATFTGDMGGSCSIGFNGFNAQGAPAVISAGHCADDNAATDTILTIPSTDDAGGGGIGGTPPSLGSELGLWGFNQFGGPGNSPTELGSPENIGTDIGVIDSINNDLDLLPEVTQWGNPADLTSDTVQVTGTADAVPGAAICKSGRTTGWTCGTVTGLGEFYVGGFNGVDDVRGVFGFESDLGADGQVLPGDSGGSVISGNNAVGIVSAGPEEGDILNATSLSDGLSKTGGYSVAVFVADPALTSHEASGTVLTDETISGTAPVGSKVVLTRNGTTTDLPVPNGTWSFAAPSTVPAGGELAFTVQAVNGYSKSAIVSYDLTVKEAPLAAPVITNPKADSLVTDSLGTITGTGVAGATVSVELTTGTAELGEAITDTVDVDANGNWEWKLDAAISYGDYSVTAHQNKDGKTESPKATSAFRIIPSTPIITSITDGQDFTEGSNPGDISGTGIAGAEVTVTIGEAVRTATVAANGTWAVSGFPVLAPGSFSVSADQTISGATSEDAYLVFSVTALQITPAGPPAPAPAPGNPAAPVVPAPDNNADGLPDTGVAGLGLIAGAGALLTVGGLGALLAKRRRTLQDA